ncbi:MAG TPA: glycosyltransferase family A protein [Polyangia bacterium]|nr:glycosyltransferase family A protein [Polyangia bacterium]
MTLNDVGVVAIGRNEGERLRQCLASLPAGVRAAVYVDSGSEDDSVAHARSIGVEVIELDRSAPFSAARARNAGWQRLRERHPTLQAVFFVDGDCQIVPGFLEEAARVLHESPQLSAVCGWRRERHAKQTIYNTICDVEWRIGGAGDTALFGGDVLIRLSELARVAGYRDELIAGEDPDLSVRLRLGGGRLVRLDRVATIHDVAMTRFRQWWKRAVRCGHCYAQLGDVYGRIPELSFWRDARRSLFWGMVVPAVATSLALPSVGLSLGLFGAYPLEGLRIYQRSRQQGFTPRESAAWSASCVVGKLPESVGVLTYRLNKLRGRATVLIEYKGPAASGRSV